MAEKRNLCAMIPAGLHSRVRTAQEESGLTLSTYMTNLLTKYFEGGNEKMAEGVRTLAFQIPESKSERSDLSSYQHLL